MSAMEWRFGYPPGPNGLPAAPSARDLRQLADGVYFPSAVEVVGEPEDDGRGQLGVSLRFELVDGRPSCTALRVVSGDGGRTPITGKTLKSLDVPSVIEQGLQWVSLAAGQLVAVLRVAAGQPYTVTDGQPSFWTNEMVDQTRSDITAIHRRRKITEEFLAEGAEVYWEADVAGEPPTKAVEERWGAEPRTASRWVTLARKRGLLPEYERPLKED